MKKSRAKVAHRQIYDEFLQKEPPCAVIGTYISFSDEEKGGRDVITLQHFSKQTFGNFIFKKQKSMNSVLQRFVEPRNGKNLMIKVTWSPQFCLVERKTNLNAITNLKIDFYERIVTYEGPEHLCVTDNITSPTLASDIQKACINIVNHVNFISEGATKITRMVLFFKVDHKDRLWLLFTSGLKVTDESTESQRAGFNPNKFHFNVSPVITVPEGVMENNTSPEKPTKTKKSQLPDRETSGREMCPGCDRFFARDDFYHISFKNIIQDYEDLIHEEEMKHSESPSTNTTVNFLQPKQPQKTDMNYHQQRLSHLENKPNNEIEFYDEAEDYKTKRTAVPPIILKIFTIMSVPKYRKLRNDPNWIYNTASVCTNCYVRLTSSALHTNRERKAQIFGEKRKAHLLEVSKAKKAMKRKQFMMEHGSLASTVDQTTSGGGSTGMVSKYEMIVGVENSIQEDDQESEFSAIRAKGEDGDGRYLMHTQSGVTVQREATQSSITSTVGSRKVPTIGGQSRQRSMAGSRQYRSSSGLDSPTGSPKARFAGFATRMRHNSSAPDLQDSAYSRAHGSSTIDDSSTLDSPHKPRVNDRKQIVSRYVSDPSSRKGLLNKSKTVTISRLRTAGGSITSQREMNRMDMANLQKELAQLDEKEKKLHAR